MFSFWYFEVRVRYRVKTFTFAISSLDEFLLTFRRLYLANGAR